MLQFVVDIENLLIKDVLLHFVQYETKQLKSQNFQTKLSTFVC